MARTFNGSSQYLYATTSLLTDEPIDMIGHGNQSNLTSPGNLVSLGNSGSANGFFAARFRGDVNDSLEAGKQDDGGVASGFARTSVPYSISTWTVIGASLINDSSRAVFLNGGNKVTDSTSVSNPTPNYISIGADLRSTLFNFFTGSIAETYVIDKNVGDEIHGSCGLGYSPIWSIPISNIRGWYPLQNDNNNRVTNGYPDLTATGSPTDSIHPSNVIYPRINGVMTF